MFLLTTLLAALSAIGIVHAMAGWAAVIRFASRPRPAAAKPVPVTILKPLHGSEPFLEEALASFCEQTHGDLQIVFGVQDPQDPALDTVRRLQQRFAHLDLTVVVDRTRHGSNGKVSNLINMLPFARHGVLVIADSDVHAAPDCVQAVLEALAQPGVGLVTTLYTAQPVHDLLPARLAATQISHGFLPGVLLARHMGRQDCLGAVMALKRETLAQLGGFKALANHLADDAVLGRLAVSHGYQVALASTVPVTSVPERRLRDVWRHELRWARTIRAIAPAGFAASIVQYPLVWAALATLLTSAAPWALALFCLVWAVRALAARGVGRALGLAPGASLWLLPLRDLLSMAIFVASYNSDTVVWRGEMMTAARPPLATSRLAPPTLVP